VALLALAREGFLAEGPGILFVELRDGTNPVDMGAYLTRKMLTRKGCDAGWRRLLDTIDPSREVLIHMYSKQRNNTFRVSVAGVGGGMVALN